MLRRFALRRVDIGQYEARGRLAWPGTREEWLDPQRPSRAYARIRRRQGITAARSAASPAPGRLERLAAELGLDRERARGWAIGQTIAWAFDSTYLPTHVETARWLMEAG